jgi:hypothetical protein
MKFSQQDKLEYISYLRDEITKVKALKETIFTNHYLHNLHNELTNFKIK